MASGPQATIAVTAVHVAASTGMSLTETIANSTPDAHVVACPTTRPWNDAAGGAMTDAPTPDCARLHAAGDLSTDGHTMTFDLIGYPISRAGTIDVALVPDAASVTPLSVVFSGVAAPVATASPAAPTADPAAAVPSPTAGISSPPAAIPNVITRSHPVTQSAAATAPAPSSQTATRTATGPRPATIAVARPGGSGPNAVTFVGLAAIGLGAWFGIARTALVRRP